MKGRSRAEVMNEVTASPKIPFSETVRRYLELIRFSHTIFALPFAMLATVWAFSVTPPNPTGAPERLVFRWQDLLGILLCMVFARSFAMAFNRLTDHQLDAQNPRTASRHLPAGLLSRSGVTAFCLLTAIGFIASTLLFLPNSLPLLLSLPVLAFLGGYSLTKRFTRLAHFWLGIALMLAPICVWIALRGRYLEANPWDIGPAVWLGGMVMFWTAGFDIIYACQDYEYDKDAGLHSIPSTLGVRNALLVAKLSHICMWLMAITLPVLFPQLGLGWIYWAAMCLVGGLLFWEHRSVSDQSLEKINLAFFQLNAVISVVFLVVGTLDTLV